MELQYIVVILKLKSLVEYMVVVMANLQRNILTDLILNKNISQIDK